jgi:N-acetylglucosamine-6-phosphate deacetylase
MTQALLNARVLLDGGFADDRAVLVEAGRIKGIVAINDPRVADADRVDLDGGYLLPGFIDCQVNGGGGVLFNDAPTVETIAAIGAAHRRYGTTGFLPTLISDDFAVMRAAIAAVDAAIEQGVPGVIGIHLEGPFLAPERHGAHDAGKFVVPDAAAIELAASLQRGRTLLTLAPDRVSPEAIRALVARGVIVAAGHTAATYEQARAALDAGITGFTHLYNAMTPLTGRAPGVVGAALEDANSWCGIIVDNFHAHPASFRVALAAKPRGKLFLVTDAMPPVGAASPEFSLYGQAITVENGRCVNSAGSLAGSALDMTSAVRNTVQSLGLPLDEAARMAATYPAQFLGLSDRGRIVAGQRADFVVLDTDLALKQVIIGGAAA